MSKRPQVDFGQQISKRTGGGGEEEREEIKGGPPQTHSRC